MVLTEHEPTDWIVRYSVAASGADPIANVLRLTALRGGASRDFDLPRDTNLSVALPLACLLASKGRRSGSVVLAPEATRPPPLVIDQLRSQATAANLLIPTVRCVPSIGSTTLFSTALPGRTPIRRIVEVRQPVSHAEVEVLADTLAPESPIGAIGFRAQEVIDRVARRNRPFLRALRSIKACNRSARIPTALRQLGAAHALPAMQTLFGPINEAAAIRMELPSGFEGYVGTLPGKFAQPTLQPERGTVAVRPPTMPPPGPRGQLWA